MINSKDGSLLHGYLAYVMGLLVILVSDDIFQSNATQSLVSMRSAGRARHGQHSTHLCAATIGWKLRNITCQESKRRGAIRSVYTTSEI